MQAYTVYKTIIVCCDSDPHIGVAVWSKVIFFKLVQLFTSIGKVCPMINFLKLNILQLHFGSD